jgi:hypothetical protein
METLEKIISSEVEVLESTEEPVTHIYIAHIVQTRYTIEVGGLASITKVS